ncbi:MAG: FAD-dependent oxidoreductase, partial [Thermocrispum sp.]
LEVTPTDGGEPRRLTAERIVLAAGSRAVVPDIPGLAGHSPVEFHTSDTVMRLDKLPASAIILGSGSIASEFAHIFSSFGVDITVVARSSRLLRGLDADVSQRFTDVAQRRWDVRLNATATAARTTDSGVALDLDTPRGPGTVVAELLLVAVGRLPNADLLTVDAAGIETVDGRVRVDQYQRTSVEGVYALGDVSSADQLKHVANHEARVVQHNLLHPDDLVAADHRYVPRAVFTSPQIAVVGRTEEELRAATVSYAVGTQDYADIAYGWAMEDTTGFVKVLADPVSGELLGVHVIGPQAPTVIQPAIQAMSFGLDARRMARGQYWIHPGMPEVLENALLNLPLR